MTAALPALLLGLLLLRPPWWVPGQPDRSPGLRFSDLQVCADEECSKVQPLQQEEEPRLLDQEVTGHMSASEVSQKPNVEQDIDPDFLETKVSPAGAGDAEKEIRAEEPAHVQLLENTLDFLNGFILCSSKMLLATLPDNFQPGAEFYGIPWQPVIATAVLGIVSFTIFFWRTILVVKSRVYEVSLKHISERVEEMKKDNEELTQKLSNYEQKIKESRKCVQEIKKQNVILSDDTISYKDKIKILEESIEILSEKAKSIYLTLESEGDGNIENQGVILENKSVEKLKDVNSMTASELSEIQIALNEAKLSEENVKSECHRVKEENARLKKEKEQLQQQTVEWSESHAELTEQIKTFERSQKDLEVALTNKDRSVDPLTNCIRHLNGIECELESEDQNKGGNESEELANGEVGGDQSEKMKHKVEQMMGISWTQTTVSIVEEDRASLSTKCDLEGEIKKLKDDRKSLQTTKASLEEECKTLQQKVEILNELYQEKKMALKKKLSREEYERQDREQRLSAADEVKTYKRRIEEMEEQLWKAHSLKSQIAALEKKVHENWLKGCAAERSMEERKIEAANLRNKLLEISQKMAVRQDEPVIIRPNTQNPPRRGSLDRHLPSPRWSSEALGKYTASDPGPAPVVSSTSRSSSPANATDEVEQTVSQEPGSPLGSSMAPLAEHPVAVNVAPNGPSRSPGAHLLGAPLGGPMSPPTRYGPLPQLYGPFGPWPLPLLLFGMYPPLEYAPDVLPGRRDLPVDPREFFPGHIPFRPPGSLGPRENFIPGARLPRPTHGPQDYPPTPPAARDLLPCSPREEAPHSSRSNVQV